MADVAQEILAARISKGDHVMDGTMGNGYDTLFLWQQVQPEGCVTAFDLQAAALETTRFRLKAAGWSGDHHTLRLIQDNHSRLAEYIKKPLKAVMFNLGFLPGSDKITVTRWNDLKQALEALRNDYLLPGGIVSVISYSGHSGGQQEQQQLLAYAECLPSEKWAVMVMRRINASLSAPVLVLIQKKPNE
ncbi:MAG: class I SAM-dependent methyltransferase [Bacillota bacterium]|nr:class I SAM-dependent methyltransferase [Bacillota bacterium]